VREVDADAGDDTELVRLFAAIGFLAIETDRIPY